MNKPFYIATFCLLLLSCKQKHEPEFAPEYMYNNSNLKVITSLINNKRNTIAIIYGNDLALQFAKDTSKPHLSGEQYLMVTWKQRPMPHWYGTKMNGEMVALEIVAVSQNNSGAISFNYQLRPKCRTQAAYRNTNDSTQIQLITGQPAAVYP